jgi:hypothetical protein
VFVQGGACQFELGFDHEEEFSRHGGGSQQRADEQAQGDEGDVGDDEVDRGHVGVVQFAEVEAFADVDARIVAEDGRELVVADVDGPDVCDAVVKEDLGEASGGGARVEGGQTASVGR